METRSGEGIDFTLFFRALGVGAPTDSDSAEEVFGPVRAAAIAGEAGFARWPEAHTRAWADWLRRYWARVAAEAWPQRLDDMHRTNPKYILRNWAVYEAYEAAERGDYTL
eukprot:7064059-Prymnesium_polylepis.1